MKEQTKTSKIWYPSGQLIRGFFDADGSFQVKIYLGKQKRVSFHVNIVLTQKKQNSLFLNQIIDSLYVNTPDAKNLKRIPQITDRFIVNQSGTLSIGSSVCIAFSNPVGQQLLELWAKNPPNAPTKLLDYRIACLLYQASKTNALDVVNQNISNDLALCDDLFIAELALLWLRFQMYTAKNKQVDRTSLETHYQTLNATSEQIQRSLEIGQKLIAKISKEQQLIAADPTILVPKITEDYLVGYHIGDGSFMVQSIINRNGSINFKMRFIWTLTDCKENYPLLLAVKAKLENEGVNSVNFSEYAGYYRFAVSHLKDCFHLVNRWKGQRFPTARQNQYDCFAEAVTIYMLGEHREDLAKAEKLIKLKWKMNPDSMQKKGSLEEDIEQLRKWFKQKKVS